MSRYTIETKDYDGCEVHVVIDTTGDDVARGYGKLDEAQRSCDALNATDAR